MKRKKNPLWYRIGVLIFGGIFCFSAYMAGRDIFEARKEAAAFRKLREAASDYMETAEQKDSIVDPADDHTTEVENTAEAEEKQELLREAAGYASLAEQNPDYVGWLKIPGTRIDYPVMSRASDPEYYLHRAFDGSRSSGGTPFLGQLSDKDSTCMIVYGHNMKNGSMFGTLDDYKSENWQTEHPVIEFFVDGEVREYEVFAAAESRVLYEDEEGFRYYRSGGDLSEEEYGKLITWLQENSDYETGIIPEYGEQILMLSTCSYHTKDGRFVVAARRISEP